MSKTRLFERNDDNNKTKQVCIDFIKEYVGELGYAQSMLTILDEGPKDPGLLSGIFTTRPKWTDFSKARHDQIKHGSMLNSLMEKSTDPLKIEIDNFNSTFLKTTLHILPSTQAEKNVNSNIYKDNYVIYKNALYLNGNKLIINNPNHFKKFFDLANKHEKPLELYLSDQEVKDLITKNTGHTPTHNLLEHLAKIAMINNSIKACVDNMIKGSAGMDAKIIKEFHDYVTRFTKKFYETFPSEISIQIAHMSYVQNMKPEPPRAAETSTSKKSATIMRDSPLSSPTPSKTRGSPTPDSQTSMKKEVGKRNYTYEAPEEGIDEFSAHTPSPTHSDDEPGKGKSNRRS